MTYHLLSVFIAKVTKVSLRGRLFLFSLSSFIHKTGLCQNIASYCLMFKSVSAVSLVEVLFFLSLKTKKIINRVFKCYDDHGDLAD